ncbi:MAG TPA: DsbA family protein [Stellaceae bacterium]|nr:DsbA family protein [Stellaceae bacterium]
MPFRLFVLLVVLLGAIASGARAEPLSAEQKSAVEALIRAYIHNHPDELLDALQSAQDQRDAAAAKAAIAADHAQLYADPTSPVGGNPHGDVTIVEFFDYRCPYCKAVEPALESLLAQDRNLRIVYKEFPVLGPTSVFASRVALAAHAQGKYGAFHRAMMATKGSIDDAVVTRVATAVGIDMDKAKAAIAAPEIDHVIHSDYALAESLSIQGTPAFVIGDQLVPGTADIDTLKQLVAAARKRG